MDISHRLGIIREDWLIFKAHWILFLQWARLLEHDVTVLAVNFVF